MVDRIALQAGIQVYVKDLQNDIDSPPVRDRLESAMQKLSVPQIMLAREWVYDAYDTSRPHPKVESLLDFLWDLLEKYD